MTQYNETARSCNLVMRTECFEMLCYIALYTRYTMVYYGIGPYSIAKFWKFKARQIREARQGKSGRQAKANRGGKARQCCETSKEARQSREASHGKAARQSREARQG
jgi:hypothetical protein